VAEEPPRLLVDGEAAERAGLLLAEALRELALHAPSPRLAIPGGSALAALEAARRRAAELWPRIRLTWVDERCVPQDDPRSNRGSARRLGLLDPPPALLLPLYRDGESPEQALERAGRDFERDFDNRLDLVLLGLGEDGHVASLFPGRALEAGFLALIRESPKPPSPRITLTRRALATAQRTLLVATGDGKRAALRQLLSGEPGLPARGLPGLTVVTDLEDLA
jgi:6-phosphogluconolactonase